MKHFKRLALCAVAAACAATLITAAGCTQESESYTPPEATPQVSKPTIITDGTLTVGVNASNAPLAGQPSSSSKIVGIDVDMAAALADQLGLKVQVVDVGTDAASALSQSKADVVMGVNKSDATSTFWTSDSYLDTSVALFALSSNSAVPTNSATTKIAVQVSSNSAWAVTNEFDSATITTTDDLKSAFSALQSGQVSYVAADAVSGTYVARNAGVDVHVVSLLQSASGYSVGVLDGNTKLKQAVSSALSALNNNGVADLIQKKWLGVSLDLSGFAAPADSTSNDKTSQISSSQDAINAAYLGSGLSGSSSTTQAA